jgi:hypothetical protein
MRVWLGSCDETRWAARLAESSFDPRADQTVGSESRLVRTLRIRRGRLSFAPGLPLLKRLAARVGSLKGGQQEAQTLN